MIRLNATQILDVISPIFTHEDNPYIQDYYYELGVNGFLRDLVKAVKLRAEDKLLYENTELVDNLPDRLIRGENVQTEHQGDDIAYLLLFLFYYTDDKQVRAMFKDICHKEEFDVHAYLRQRETKNKRIIRILEKSEDNCDQILLELFLDGIREQTTLE